MKQLKTLHQISLVAIVLSVPQVGFAQDTRNLEATDRPGVPAKRRVDLLWLQFKVLLSIQCFDD